MGLALLQAISIGVGFVALLVVVIVVVSVLVNAVKVVKEYERGVIFRLGRVQGSPKALGLFPREQEETPPPNRRPQPKPRPPARRTREQNRPSALLAPPGRSSGVPTIEAEGRGTPTPG